MKPPKAKTISCEGLDAFGGGARCGAAPVGTLDGPADGTLPLNSGELNHFCLKHGLEQVELSKVGGVPTRAFTAYPGTKLRTLRATKPPKANKEQVEVLKDAIMAGRINLHKPSTGATARKCVERGWLLFPAADLILGGAYPRCTITPDGIAAFNAAQANPGPGLSPRPSYEDLMREKRRGGQG